MHHHPNRTSIIGTSRNKEILSRRKLKVVSEGESKKANARGYVYLVSFWRKVMRSLRSLGFLRPPNAILVPGMYFLGFSRYSNWARLAHGWIHQALRNVRECRCSTQHPSACWRRCRRSPRPGQTCGRRDRKGWGRSCYPHPPSGCGTVRSGSVCR